MLAFHGTKEENIHSIAQTGFRLPGDANFEHATDAGNITFFVRKILSLFSGADPVGAHTPQSNFSSYFEDGGGT